MRWKEERRKKKKKRHFDFSCPVRFPAFFSRYCLLQGSRSSNSQCCCRCYTAKQLSNVVGGKCHKILFCGRNKKKGSRKYFQRPLVGLFFLRRTKNRWLRSRGTLIITPQNGASPTSRPFANNNKRKNDRSSRNTRGVGGLHNGGQGGTDDSVFILFFRGKRW